MKSASLSQKAYSMLMFVAVSVLAGLLLAGLAVPFTALAGGATKTAAESLEYLPADLETPPQSERSRIIMGNGKVLATFFDENRIYVPLSKIAGIMQDAQIAIEDHRFYEHGAIDLQGLGRAFFKTAMGDTQGASTLTQQYVKLVQVEAAKARGDKEGQKAATEVSLERKFREMRYAMAVEDRLSKEEILERYLNIAYYGNGAYGVESAAHHYWGTTAEKLTLDQAAMLAGIVQNPVAYNPVRNPKQAMDRRDVVLNRMAQLNIITADQAQAAKKVVFDPATVRKTPNGCISSQFPFLCDYVVETLLKQPSLGDTREERENLLKRGGLSIRTLINPDAQLAAEAAVARQISPTDAVLAGSVLVQPSTGLIIAMAQSRPKMGTGPGETYYNINVEKAMGGAEGYQAGSTFKPFVTAAALELGMTPGKEYVANSPLDTTGFTWKGCKGPFKLSGEPWKPKNYDRSWGQIDMMTATQKSVNSYYVQLMRDVGVCNSVQMAERLGIKLSLGENLQQAFGSIPSFVLGTAEVTPLSMAEAYATFANRGIHCDPIIIRTIHNKDGAPLAVPSANCKQVIPPEVADGVNYILQSVMTKGTGTVARMSGGRPQAGKTGTTNQSKAVWFAGYTPDMAGVAYIAVDKKDPWWKNHTQKIQGYRTANGDYLRGSGGGDAGQIWKAAMASALQGVPETPFTKPSKKVLEGEKVPVPDVSGLGYEEAKAKLEAAGFSTTRAEVYSSRREGAFIGISPSKEAVKFSTILMKFSKGPKPVVEPSTAPTTPVQPPAQPPAQPPGNPPGDG